MSLRSFVTAVQSDIPAHQKYPLIAEHTKVHPGSRSYLQPKTASIIKDSFTGTDRNNHIWDPWNQHSDASIPPQNFPHLILATGTTFFIFHKKIISEKIKVFASYTYFLIRCFISENVISTMESIYYLHVSKDFHWAEGY